MVRGTKLGPYEILEPLGAGGMGEVYKARDTRLNRTVAIKVLNARLAGDPDLRQRLEQEARAVSNLNHAHICTLYDVGQQDGIDFLVLEHLEGETLADRLKKGPLPLDLALRYAIEIAGALDQAHRRGIVHRDLKPGNVMLTKAGTKLLDFGLAKFRGAKIGGADETALLTQNLTSEGQIVGTLQYMSPEQLEGKEADARSDIFAFGALLYEMLSGRKAFNGASQATLISAIIATEPRQLEPAAYDRIVQACLAKDPDERWQSAADLRWELQWLAQPSATPIATAKPRRALTSWVVAAASIFTLLALGWIHFRETALEQKSVRFTIPTTARLPSQVRLSPDGTRLAFVGQNAEGQFVLWIRVLDQPDSHSVAGTDGAQFPFWAPDNRHLGYFDHHSETIKTIDSFGGTPQTLASGIFGRGGDWLTDGTIIFSSDEKTGVYRTTSNGGVPVQIASTAGEGRTTIPLFLHDGKHFIFANRSDTLSSEKSAKRSIMVTALDSKESRLLVPSPYSAALSSGTPPYLVFVADGALMAQEITSNFQLKGEAVRVLDAVAVDGNHSTADMSISNNGTLAFNASVYQHELVWLDRSGNRLGKSTPTDRYSHPSLSPDQKQVVFERIDPRTGVSTLWKLDVERGTTTLFDGNGALPLFSPDGSTVAFNCRIDEKPFVCRKGSGGAAQREGWFEAPAAALICISPDQRFLSYMDIAKEELWIRPLTGDLKPFKFDSTKSSKFHGAFSPDGKWIAYSSNETGEFEVYVQPFPATGAKWKVSSSGGGQPRWRRDNQELFYRTEDGKLMAVPVSTKAGFEPGVPHKLFDTSSEPLYPNLGLSYDVTADGQRFIINMSRDESHSSPLTIITNWRNLLKR